MVCTNDEKDWGVRCARFVAQRRPDRHKPGRAAGGKHGTNKGTVYSFIAYFGDYAIQGKQISIKVGGSTRSDWRNRTLKRTIESTFPELAYVDHPDKATSVRIMARRCE
jgi:hypothetical protein